MLWDRGLFEIQLSGRIQEFALEPSVFLPLPLPFPLHPFLPLLFRLEVGPP